MEYKNDLNDPWQVLETISGTGEMVAVTDSTGVTETRFYQVVTE